MDDLWAWLEFDGVVRLYERSRGFVIVEAGSTSRDSNDAGSTSEVSSVVRKRRY